MYMKKILAMALALVCLFSSALAAANVQFENVVDANENRRIKSQVGDKNGVPENPVIEGENPFTGLPYDGEYMPILVSVSNNSSARPQWGVNKADMIYEVPIMGNTLTRLFCMFMSEHPVEVGPVRSARSFHIDIREEWDSAMMYAGSRPEAACTDAELMQKNFTRYGVTTTNKGVRLNYDLNGSSQGADKTKRVSYHFRPNNLSVDLTLFEDALSVYDFTARPRLFTDDLPSTGAVANFVSVYYGDDQTDSHYEYNEDDNLYYRFVDGEPYVDLHDPETQLAFANVVVQRVALDFYRGGSDRPKVPLFGQGNADIFMGGRYIAGSWIRDDAEARTVFLDADGNEIAFQRGVTWINICGEKTQVSYE